MAQAGCENRKRSTSVSGLQARRTRRLFSRRRLTPGTITSKSRGFPRIFGGCAHTSRVDFAHLAWISHRPREEPDPAKMDIVKKKEWAYSRGMCGKWLFRIRHHTSCLSPYQFFLIRCAARSNRKLLSSSVPESWKPECNVKL